MNATYHGYSRTDRWLEVLRPACGTIDFLSVGASRKRRERFEERGFSPPPFSVGMIANVVTDETALATVRALSKFPNETLWRRIAAETADAAEMFTRNGWVDNPRAYLSVPPVLTKPDVCFTRHRGMKIETLTFPSLWEPQAGEPGRDRWLGYTANLTMRAYMLRHREPRPWIVWVHGAGMGSQFDTHILGATKLFHRLGCNVVMPILPLHGTRRAGRSGARFPTLDAVDNVHGLAQSVWDVRRILSWVSAQDAAGVGLVGTSLGGNVAAVVAGVERPLACVVGCVPVVDLPLMMQSNMSARIRGMEYMQVFAEHSRMLHRTVSPLSVVPATPVTRRFLVAGTADRIVDPDEQVWRLWEHWDRPNIQWANTGHSAHFRNAAVSRAIENALRMSGLARPQTARADAGTADVTQPGTAASWSPAGNTLARDA